VLHTFERDGTEKPGPSARLARRPLGSAKVLLRRPRGTFTLSGCRGGRSHCGGFFRPSGTMPTGLTSRPWATASVVASALTQTQRRAALSRRCVPIPEATGSTGPRGKRPRGRPDRYRRVEQKSHPAARSADGQRSAPPSPARLVVIPAARPSAGWLLMLATSRPLASTGRPTAPSSAGSARWRRTRVPRVARLAARGPDGRYGWK
jgi:hypothetical protein